MSPNLSFNHVSVKKAFILFAVFFVGVGIFFSLHLAHAATYYVDNVAGSDANNGTSSSTPWATIAKVNSSTFQPGDTVLFKRGDTWREELIPPSSGASGTPITFGSYGVGQKPIITGADLITSWSTPPAKVLKDFYTTLHTPASLNLDYNSAEQKVATYFVASSSYDLIQATINLEIVGNPTGQLTLSVYRDTGSQNVSTTDLGDSAAINVSSLTASYTSYNFTWSAPISLTGGSGYWLVLSSTGSVDPSNYVNWQQDIAAGAGHYISKYNGSSWTNTSGYGAYFQAYASGATPANVWAAPLTTQVNYLLENGAMGAAQSSESALASQGDWYWGGGYLYLYSTSNPETFYTKPGVEAGQRQYAIYSTRNYNTFDDFDVYGANGIADIMLGNNSGIGDVVENCEVHHNMQTGIYFWGIQSGIAQDNYIHDIWNGGTHSGNGIGHGITVYGSHALANQIRWNRILNNYDGIFLYGAGSNPLGTQIYGNIVGPNISNGIDQFQVDAASDPTRVYNNTVIHNPSSAVGDRAGHGIDIQDNGSDGIDIQNNIIYSDYTGVNSDVQLVNLSSNINMTNVTINHNLYYLAPGSTAYLAQDTNGNHYTSLASWQTYLNGTTYLGKDSSSTYGDPKFIDYLDANYTLSSSSPAINAGANLGSTYEMGFAASSTWPNGVSTLNQTDYGSGWDIGAYVYTQTTTPTIAFAAPSANASLSGTVHITASSSAIAPASLKAVSLAIDGGTVISTSSPSLAYSWNTLGVSNGSHTLTLRATDDYGNQALSTLAISVDNAPAPVVSVAAGPGTHIDYHTTSGESTAAATSSPSSASSSSSISTIVPTSTPPLVLNTPTSSTPTIVATSTTSLQAVLVSLESQLQVLLREARQEGVAISTSTPASHSSSSVFIRNLSLWDTGPEVQQLQQYLVNQNVGPAAEALKTHGTTQTFGYLTLHALIEFQKARHITPAAGYFGPITRGVVNAVVGN